MNSFSLFSTRSKTKIFSGLYPSFTACLEDAVLKNINLENIDLRHQNIVNANLDGAYMPMADFTGTNLSGANLSEAILQKSIFHHTALYNCCLCLSDLRYSNFTDADFGGTDISGADIRYSKFSTLSCLDLDFANVSMMEGCSFINIVGIACEMSNTPIVLKGILGSPIVIFDKSVKIGNEFFSTDIIPNVLNVIKNCLLHSDPSKPRESNGFL